ncbi:MAG: cytochrome c-type biogenesis protein [Pseudomonadota bacterium]
MKFYFLLLLLSPMFVFAKDSPVQFENNMHALLYDEIIDEIRCLVCQNQSLADSNAPLAQDLRKEIIEMIRTDKNENEIKSFLVDRYGDFVLYRPPVQTNTWLLWAGPFIFLLLGISIAVFLIRKQTKENIEAIKND